MIRLIDGMIGDSIKKSMEGRLCYAKMRFKAICKTISSLRLGYIFVQNPSVFGRRVFGARIISFLTGAVS